MAKRKRQADRHADAGSRAEAASSSKASEMDRRSGSARSASLVPSYSRARTKRVWLTLDDGPHPAHTKAVLKVLKDEGVTATFFVVGENASRNGNLVKQIHDAGHGIGNHSYSHKDLTKLSEAQIIKEIRNTHTLIESYLGNDPMFRPPYGAHNALVDKVATDFGYRVILWNVDTLDWDKKYQPDKWVQHGIDQIRNRDNSTVLAHDIHKSTAGHYDNFIRRIKDIGNVTFERPLPLIVA